MKRWYSPDKLLLPAGQALLESTVLSVAIATIGGASLPGDLRTRSLAMLQIAAAALGVLYGRGRLRLPAALSLTVCLTITWLHWMVASTAAWTLASLQALLFAPTRLSPDLSGTRLGLLWAVALYQAGRGLVIGAGGASAALVLRSFMRGIVGLVALFSLIELASIRLPEALRDALLRAVLGYFALGFALVALAQRAAVARQRGLPQSLSLAWLAACLPPIGLTFILALAIARGRGVVTTATHGAALLGHHLAVALMWIAQGIVIVLGWVGHLLPAGAGTVTRQVARQLEQATDLSAARPPPAPIAVTAVVDVRYVLILTVPLLIALYVGLIRRASGQEDAIEDSTSAWSWRLFGSQLARLLRDARAGLRARREPDVDAEADGEPPADARGLYRAFLRWARRRGHERAPGLTPLEFRAQLAQAIPAAAPQITRITAHYLEARYAERPPSEADLGRARDDLHSLESARLDEAAQPARRDRPH